MSTIQNYSRPMSLPHWDFYSQANSSDEIYQPFARTNAFQFSLHRFPMELTSPWTGCWFIFSCSL